MISEGILVMWGQTGLNWKNFLHGDLTNSWAKESQHFQNYDDWFLVRQITIWNKLSSVLHKYLIPGQCRVEALKVLSTDPFLQTEKRLSNFTEDKDTLGVRGVWDIMLI